MEFAKGSRKRLLRGTNLRIGMIWPGEQGYLGRRGGWKSQATSAGDKP